MPSRAITSGLRHVHIMSKVAAKGSTFNMTPTPRILNMLGEINLDNWRCVAEIVDNSVDGFLSVVGSPDQIPNPEVIVQLPTQSDAQAQITIMDNGPGMDESTLERAVRAGWSSRPALEALGLYGMGFNIATARLGTVTTIWTTRAGDPEWVGLKVDFQELARQGNFSTPRLTEPKPDTSVHGTRVTINKLRPGPLEWFSKSANRTRLRRELARAYASMLRQNGRPITFTLKLNTLEVRPHRHCVWGGPGNEERIVHTKTGAISSYQRFDIPLTPRNFCTRCIQWLAANGDTCLQCEQKDAVQSRKRSINGWLGVQTYLDSTEYGIDFIRFGRKIEMSNKDFFVWRGQDGSEEDEYPIDDPRRRGRIVGEIHIDHVRVNYSKDRFDRLDPAWEEMARTVRGDSPLRPQVAKTLGMQPNESPLAQLFNAFRRSNPGGGKTDEAGAWQKLLLVRDNDRAREMAELFQEGVPEYQSDKAWWDLILHEESLLLRKSKTGTDAAAPATPIAGFVDTGVAVAEASPKAPHPRSPDPALTRNYVHAGTGFQFDLKAYSTRGNPALNSAWDLSRTNEGVWEFLYDPTHEVFRSATLTPLDGLLAELAHRITFDSHKTARATSFVGALVSLRQIHAGSTRIDPAELIQSARQCIEEVASAVARSLPESEGKALFESLSPLEQKAILSNMASRSVSKPQRLLASGEFLAHAPPTIIANFFRKNPELFLDGHCWVDEFGTLAYDNETALEIARTKVVEKYSALLADAIWLADAGKADLLEAARPRVLRAMHAVELLAPAGGEP